MRSAAVLDRVEAAASGQDTDDLLVLWQRPSTREIVPIGRFSRTANGYSFVYTRAAAEKRDFRPLLGLPDLHQRYDSQQIPAVFSQRVMSPSRSDYGKYLAMLGLSEKEKSQILSINQNNDPNRLYKEVWIGLGGMQSAVYATEVSMEEYLTYTTEETEKVEVMNRAAQLGGDIETAIRQLAIEKRNNKKK